MGDNHRQWEIHGCLSSVYIGIWSPRLLKSVHGCVRYNDSQAAVLLASDIVTGDWEFTAVGSMMMIGVAVRGTVVNVDGRFLSNRGCLDGRGERSLCSDIASHDRPLWTDVVFYGRPWGYCIPCSAV